MFGSKENDNRRILITGARGFIGSRLVDFLAGRGYTIVKYTGDIRDIASMESTDLVVHLAAKVDEIRVGREKDDFLTVNVLGTQHVIDLCLKYHCKLIFFSSMAAVHPQSLYGLSKFLAEESVKFYAIHYGLQAVTMRPCSIYDETVGLNRSGKQVDLFRGRNYPLAYLLRDVERIIQNHDFTRKYKIYTTTLFFEHHVLYWLRKIVRKIKNP